MRPRDYVIPALGVFVLWLGLGIVLPQYLADSPESQGVFGDAFGGATSLFTALAFLGTIVAIWHQRLDAKQARIDQRELLETQGRQAEVQVIAAKLHAHSSLLAAHVQSLDSTARTLASRRAAGEWVQTSVPLGFTDLIKAEIVSIFSLLAALDALETTDPATSESKTTIPKID